MQLFLEPVDVWLFRDGRPFTAREDHRAVSLFPPYPTVVQGAIRSFHAAVVRKVDLRDQQAVKEVVGDAENFGSLRLRGPFLARRQGGAIGRYFRVPADAVLVDRKVHPDGQTEFYYRAAHPRARSELSGVSVSLPDELEVLLYPPEGTRPAKEPPDLWMEEAELMKCLHGELARAVGGDQLFVREPRIGIGLRDDTRTSEEGALYQAEFIRLMSGMGLWVEVKGYEGWPDRGMLQLGGEGRGAWFIRLDQELGWPCVPDPLPPRFKVYFASPAYFSGGWRPNQGWGVFFEGQVRLQAVAIKRYESVGGFDLAKGQHKPAQRYVPAGSVYYFVSDGRARLRKDMDGAISEWGREIGFGQIIIVEW
ncbi:type III-B CRISPR module-associated protein Cmr3 [Thermoflexus sp.]|uniref:type III-B CRISPR module-associated protein Cmr3 n=1 Tax=Thermoflexus sp. TaxID=1969742 RepID=UPI002ADE4027|nr:type III-B CRISPR module-associated protein Cmr3 [Thermoflexus sp.]